MKKAMKLMALAMLALTTNALAHDKTRLFLALDSDSDGFIDQREVTADTLLSTALRKWDKNRDGLISKTEFLAYLGGLYLK